MKRILKILGYGLAGLVLLVLTALLLLKLFFDPNDFRDEISARVTELTGRDFAIAGDLDLSVFPRVAVEINDVTLGNAPGFDDAVFAGIESAAVGVEFMPLIGREIVVDEVRLSGLELNLQVNAAGEDNWSDLTAAGDAAEESAAAEDPAGDTGFTTRKIAGLDLENASVSYRDDQAGTRYRVENANLRTGTLEWGLPFDVTGGLRLVQGDDELVADIDITANANLDLAAEQYELTNPDIDIALSGPTVGDRPLGVAFDAQFLAADLNKENIRLKEFALKAHDVTVRGNMSGNHLFQAEPQLTGTLTVDEFSPKALLQELGGEPFETADANAMTRLTVEATVKAGANFAQLTKLKVRLDDTNVTGSLRIIDIANEVLRFNLQADEIDMDRYLPLESETEAETAEAGPPVAVPADTIKALNLQGGVSVGTAFLSGMRFTDLEFRIKVEDGRARLHPSKAKFYGGTYSGDIRLNVNQNPPLMSMDETVQGIRIEDMSRDLFGDVMLSGVAAGQVKLTATGRNTDQLGSSANGSLAFDIADGAIEGIDIWHEILAKTAPLRGEPAPAKTGPNRTPFTEFAGTATVADGVLNNDRLVVALEYLRLNGSGTVTLADTALDYRAEASVLDIPELSVDDTLRSLCDPITVYVTGTVSSPSPRPDIAGCAKKRVERELEEKKEELKDRAEEELKKKLEEILGK